MQCIIVYTHQSDRKLMISQFMNQAFTTRPYLTHHLRSGVSYRNLLEWAPYLTHSLVTTITVGAQHRFRYQLSCLSLHCLQNPTPPKTFQSNPSPTAEESSQFANSSINVAETTFHLIQVWKLFCLLLFFSEGLLHHSFNWLMSDLLNWLRQNIPPPHDADGSESIQSSRRLWPLIPFLLCSLSLRHYLWTLYHILL